MLHIRSVTTRLGRRDINVLALGAIGFVGEGVHVDLEVFAAACAGPRVGLSAEVVATGTAGKDDGIWINGRVGIDVGNTPN
jgi:hypothetical protein